MISPLKPAVCVHGILQNSPAPTDPRRLPQSTDLSYRFAPWTTHSPLPTTCICSSVKWISQQLLQPPHFLLCLLEILGQSRSLSPPDPPVESSAPLDQQWRYSWRPTKRQPSSGGTWWNQISSIRSSSCKAVAEIHAGPDSHETTTFSLGLSPTVIFRRKTLDWTVDFSRDFEDSHFTGWQLPHA